MAKLEKIGFSKPNVAIVNFQYDINRLLEEVIKISFFVRSATDLNASYRVDLSKRGDIKDYSCQCPHYDHKGLECRHIKLIKKLMEGKDENSN